MGRTSTNSVVYHSYTISSNEFYRCWCECRRLYDVCSFVRSISSNVFNRIRKAVQIEKLEDKVVLFPNAIYLESGKYLRIKSDPFNVGSQAIVPENALNGTNNDPYIVKTMRFDDILPVLKANNIRNAIMKVDIQWSEAFLCLTGNQTFDYVNIPVVLMEWDPVPHHRQRMKIVIDYFTARGYTPTVDLCKILNISQAFQSWPGDMFWIKLNQSEIC